MTVGNAIKKLSKLGSVQNNGSYFYIVVSGKELSFFGNRRGGDERNITCINVRRLNDVSDSMTDYSAGSFYQNLTQAIKWGLQ